MFAAPSGQTQSESRIAVCGLEENGRGGVLAPPQHCSLPETNNTCWREGGPGDLCDRVRVRGEIEHDNIFPIFLIRNARGESKRITRSLHVVDQGSTAGVDDGSNSFTRANDAVHAVAKRSPP